ncbi:hypothetical protein NSK_003369 [Nannochloropsis salina CCMP1776]|uniref:Uncharacterized protein n=1 Tax=Nannochloropsis salina CCMP1776 TaxID=1027361 RepID=A0A4D9D1W6_9STRA|nr:hypothetical protein NSK_003369 [Nannochloropsis salina CCMP1776]|eukprot:TFJ85410.1 hypothetical protein NSK_003369 [Nannochloropsis salina CCMP1776]
MRRYVLDFFLNHVLKWPFNKVLSVRPGALEARSRRQRRGQERTHTSSSGHLPVRTQGREGRNQTACIKKLLYKGEADPNAQDHLQHTPFMMAASFGKINSAREILRGGGSVLRGGETRALAGTVGDTEDMLVAVLA